MNHKTELFKDGRYETEAGSVVLIRGGVVEIAFDFFEEGGCIECQPEPCETAREGVLIWYCDECGKGASELLRGNAEATEKK